MFAPGTVLLHDSLAPAGANLLFSAPRDIIVAHDAAGARAALARLEAASRAGLHAAGFLAYELGFVFEERLAPHLPASGPLPLLWLGLYDAPERLTAAEVDARLAAAAGPFGRARGITPLLDQPGYGRAFAEIKRLIAAGDTYQVNLTFKAGFRLEGDPVALYRQLVSRQPVAYGALIHTGTHWILSRSPELFVSSRDGVLEARPMKGTMPRGPTPEADAKARLALGRDAKNRAENLMIVDLLRNDLARVAEIGSVQVTDLFSVETYSTLHTMTSGISARRRPEVTTTQLLENLFPCGSITGAPKLRAMEIIHALETGPRGVYTGSIGHFAPNGDFTLNVAIRTAVIDAEGRGEIGIGGGIVADSDMDSEYREALLKMAFFTAPDITLIETLLWREHEGYFLLQRHLDRLAASAAYFGLACDRAAIEALLEGQSFPASAMRVRLTLDASGPHLTAVPLPPNPDVFRFTLAPDPLDSQSPWLAHKTTNRDFYDQPRQRAQAQWGVDEVVFRNERGELTEGSITSLFIERAGKLLTPPLSSGLLPGTLRAELLATGKADEAVLTPDDLAGADKIWLGNSVRGLIRAHWFKPQGDAA